MGSPRLLIVAGDFNAKSQTWNGGRTDQRGVELEEWMATWNLHLSNDGTTPTLRRNNAETHPDLTLCSPADAVADWRVNDDEESLSDHLYIEYTIADETPPPGQPSNETWKMKKLDKEKLQKEIDERIKEAFSGGEIDAATITNILREACRASSHGIHPELRRRRPTYWWNAEVAACRKLCNRSRRLYVRARAKLDTAPELVQVRQEEYKKARITYRLEIEKSQRRAWAELCESLRNDVWGKPYKIIRKKFGARRLPITPDTTALEQLFPNGRDFDRTSFTIHPEDIQWGKFG